MVGGLLNLVAVGNQNIILHGNPQKTFWSSTYKRITNFGMQNFRLDYEGLRQLSVSSETTYTFKVKRYAELLMDTYFVIQIPDIYSPIYPDSNSNKWIPYEFKWIKNLGAMMIKNIKFTIGGSLIQQITGTDMVILANRDLSATYKKKWDEMIGNTPDMYDPANAFGRNNRYPNVGYNDGNLPEPSIRGKQLRIPLPIWWGFTSQQAFPLVALQYNILQIDITLRPLRELFQIRDVINPQLNYPVIAPNMTVPEHQFFRFLQPPPNPELIYTTTVTNWKENSHLSCQYCFLSEEEAKMFALQPQKYLIKEYHQTLFTNVGVTDKVWLQNSTALVLDWMFLFQRADVPLRNEWSNFTNWAYDYLPKQIELLPEIMEIGPFGNFGYGRNPDTSFTMLYGTGNFHPENQKSILLLFGITFDGTVREEIRTGNIYLQDQQYLTSEGYGSTSLEGLYAYNFCLDTSPFQLQPSGAINLSKFSKIEFEFTTITPPIDPNSTYLVICDPVLNQQIGVNKSIYKLYEYGFNLYVLEERYNVLTFLSGNAAMMNAR
uniref:Major capsid protein N-terminal domain-containing protein n=1 Tax=viral metagenome TaxID=1070528 RepID=A0A6C0B895_9ZZZZ